MSKKAFFRESKNPVFDCNICDKCGLQINTVQDGKCFWNPNKNARHKNICQNCHDVWQYKRNEQYQKWRTWHDELEKQENKFSEIKPIEVELKSTKKLYNAACKLARKLVKK